MQQLSPESSQGAEEALFASLARHPRHVGRGPTSGHPLPDRCRVEDLFDWEAVAKELGKDWTPANALAATFGAEFSKSRAGLLRTRCTFAGKDALHGDATRAQIGVILLPDFIDEAEETVILKALRETGDDAVVPWTTRQGGGLSANFGPSYIPDSGFKVDKHIAFTDLPAVLWSFRSRVEALLRLADINANVHEVAQSARISIESALRVGFALRTYAMSSATRAGHQCSFNQAFVQRYQVSSEMEMESQTAKQEAVMHDTREEMSQALGMHFDSRTENGEVVVGLSLGAEPGNIFFSRQGPKKGNPFPVSVARQLQDRGDGMLIELPRRAVYMFYGFARYYLRHGVPWCGPSSKQLGKAMYDRLTVTLRSVPRPTLVRSGRRKRDVEHKVSPPEPEKKRQRSLQTYLDGFTFTPSSGTCGQAQARSLPGSVSFFSRLTPGHAEAVLEESCSGSASRVFPMCFGELHRYESCGSLVLDLVSSDSE